MTKKIWRLLCVLAVFLTGMLLYEGGVLILRFHAHREGFYACFAGICAALFYLVAFFRSTKENGKVNQARMFLAEGSAALLAVSLTLYSYRYEELIIQLRMVGVVFFWSVIFIWKSLLCGKSRKLRENHMKEKLFELFPDGVDRNLPAEESSMEECVREALGVKGRIWELRWSVAILATSLVAGFTMHIRDEWYIWVFFLVIAAGFAWIAGRDSIYTARILSEFIEQHESSDLVAFFLIYYQNASRQWESMIPMIQIYLPIALCQCSEYDKALELLQCMQKRPEEEAYYLVWEAEAYKQKEDWNSLGETLKKLKKAISHMPEGRRNEMEEKCRAYEKNWREKGD